MSLNEKITQFIVDELSQPDIGWANGPYEFYLIFGPNDPSKFPWVKSSWEVYFEPYFDQLVKQVGVPKDTGVRVLKYQPEKRLSKRDNKEFVYHSEVKFGRLKWDLKSHEKWTRQIMRTDISRISNYGLLSGRFARGVVLHQTFTFRSLMKEVLEMKMSFNLSI